MGSATNSVGQMLAYMKQSAAAVNVSSVTITKNSTQQATNSFDSFLNKASVQVSQNDTKLQDTDATKSQNVVDTSKQPVKSESNTPVKETDNKYGKFDDQVNNQLNDQVNEQEESEVIVEEIETVIADDTEQIETTNSEVNNKLQATIFETGKELVSKIAQALEIDEEDLLSAMQVLGMTFGDLLDPQNIQLLVESAGGTDKALDLITDSDLYANMQDLMEGADSMRSELMNEFDLSEEDFKNIVAASKDDFQVNIDENVIVTAEKVVTDKPEIVVNEIVNEAVNENEEPITKDIKAPQSKDTTPEIQVKDTSQENEPTTFKPVEETSEAPKEEHKESESKLNDNGQNTNPFNQLLNNIAEAVDTNPMSNVSYTDRAQMENIIRQITDRITISAGTEETSMELQLHPAHLGNVNILLTSTKDGIVAKFTAQNQIVKEAVESQMVQLQQKFEEQGIKVTAVEVTIASHAFEQNLQQNDKNSGFEEQQAKSKKTLRRINLSEGFASEDEEELSESDILAAKVMEMNGNTVDYSA
jgi:flagellar hook-length control protein FliK